MLLPASHRPRGCSRMVVPAISSLHPGPAALPQGDHLRRLHVCIRFPDDTEKTVEGVNPGETLLHARDSAGEVSENLAESRKLVKMIQRRMAQNKCFMYGVVVMVVGITLSLILLQLVPSSPANAEKPASPSDVQG